MKAGVFVLGVVLCGWSAWASPAGDVNDDGVVNVADLVRAQKIAAGELSFESAADVDGDSVVTEIDVWLIREATLGRPVPELVDHGQIGPSGGALSDETVTFTIPAGSSGQNHLALLRCADATLDDETVLHNVYMVCGLSTNLSGFSVRYDNCGGDTGLAVGAYLKPYDAGDMQWDWQAFPESGFVRSGSQVSRTFLSPGASDVAISHSLKVALVTADAPPPVARAAAVTVATDVPVDVAGVPGHRFAGYLYTGWISDKYHVYTKDWGTVSYSDLETVCGYLYAIHDKLKSMGFPLDTTHASIFPVEVYICRGMKDDGGSVHNPVTGARRLEASASLLSLPGELKSTIGHELMHYVLSEYTHGDAFAFESTEDAITTWFEAVASDNPSHLSGNYTSRRAAPLKSLFCPITRGWLGGRDWSAQEKHGYGTAAFVDYCFDAHPGWIHELAQKVSSGQTIERALDILFTEKHGALHDLDRTYLDFARDYLLAETNRYSSSVTPDSIFSSDSSTDLTGMYELISIKKASTNLLEEQEVDLTVRDYGCGVVQFKIFKPDRIFAPHTQLRVTAPEICKSIDLLMLSRDSAGVNHSQIATGTYGQNTEGQNEWSCVIALPPDARYILLSALATVANEGLLSDYAEDHDITVTYQFQGDYYMPMQESFIRFTELSSRESYYDNQIMSDAIVRIVDPIGTAGLKNFSVYRWVDNYSQPGVNYTVNVGISGMTASRRTTDAFQIRLFSNTTVPDLPPYTINISTDGYSPVTRDYQNPVVTGDGTPQLELMVYYASDTSQVYPGEEAYRIRHEITSAAELRQSADGLSGGIAVDIPAQIDGYTCLIYLIASEAGGTQGHTAFIASIHAKEEEGQ